jgi:uncharacterized protein (TIGR02453 family)
MLQKTTLQFLQTLNKNNDKSWFDANRKKYEAAKLDFNSIVAALIKGIANFDAPIGTLEVKNCVFRINRDVRFSKDKSPYKTNMGASFNQGGKKIQKAGYYFHVEPGNKSFLAGGIYMPEANDLQKIRQEIDYNFADFKKIIDNKKFTATYKALSTEDGMVLARPPKGYAPDNAAIAFLKHKSFIATMPVKDAELTDANLIKNTLANFKLLFPLIQFLNHAIEE